jgi:hypothetical protein
MKSRILILVAIIVSFGFFTETSFAQVTFSTGKLQVRVDDYGAMRFWTIEGTDTVQQLNRASALVAGNVGDVFDYWNDVDIEVPNVLVTNPTMSDFEISGTYNNAYSGAPPDVLVAQNVYGWQNQSYALVKMVVTNRETSNLPTLVGLDILQYIDETWENDSIYYDATNQIMIQSEIHSMGVKILSEPTTSAQIFAWFTDYQYSDMYYTWMTTESLHTDTLVTNADGGVGILSGTSTTLATNASKTIYFGIAAGNSKANMLTNMQMVEQKYNSITAVGDHQVAPTNYTLNQNYPNPFNPSTKISYQIPESGFVTLKVYNALGKEVATLVNSEKSAGRYEVNFNANDLSSGIYFYTIQAGKFQETRKMILLK